MRGVFNGIAVMLLGIVIEIYGFASSEPAIIGIPAIVIALVGFLAVLYYSSTLKTEKTKQSVNENSSKDI